MFDQPYILGLNLFLIYHLVKILQDWICCIFKHLFIWELELQREMRFFIHCLTPPNSCNSEFIVFLRNSFAPVFMKAVGLWCSFLDVASSGLAAGVCWPREVNWGVSSLTPSLLLPMSLLWKNVTVGLWQSVFSFVAKIYGKIQLLSLENPTQILCFLVIDCIFKKCVHFTELVKCIGTRVFKYYFIILLLSTKSILMMSLRINNLFLITLAGLHPLYWSFRASTCS